MQKSAIFSRMYGCLSLIVLVLAGGVLPVAAGPLSIDQTLDEEYREITGHINRLKKAKPQWRERLAKELGDQDATKHDAQNAAGV